MFSSSLYTYHTYFMYFNIFSRIRLLILYFTYYMIMYKTLVTIKKAYFVQYVTLSFIFDFCTYLRAYDELSTGVVKIKEGILMLVWKCLLISQSSLHNYILKYPCFVYTMARWFTSIDTIWRTVTVHSRYIKN